MTRRHGYTLVELLAAIAGASVVLGVVVGVLALGYRTDRAARAHLHAAQSLDRLAEQFRRDCHGTVEGTASLPEGPGWRLTLPGQTVVEYRLGPDGLDRTEHVGGEVRHRETFVLPPGTGAAVTFDPTEARGEGPDAAPNEGPGVVSGKGVARLELTPSDDADRRRAGRSVRIVAAVGLDHRFAPAAADRQAGDNAGDNASDDVEEKEQEGPER